MTFRSRIATLFCGLLLSLPALAAEPSIHEIYQAAESGRVADAQRMIDQVLKAHPDSAKAHYIDAELQVREGHLAQARSELATAERLAPGLPFAKPAAVEALHARLQPVARTLAPSLGGGAVQPAPGLPWETIAGVGVLLALCFVLTRLFLARQSPVQVLPPAGAYPGGPLPAGMPSGAAGYALPGAYAQPAPAAGGIGTGILGGVATGLAVGAGVAAGEALMHRVLDGGRREEPFLQAVEPSGAERSGAGDMAAYDMGGQDFGLTDAGGGWDGGDSASSSWADGSGDWS